MITTKSILTDVLWGRKSV